MSTDKLKTILVVEDDIASKQYILLLLKRLNYEVLVAETGEQALVLMKDKIVDLMLLDIALGPGISGIELGIRLKKEERLVKAQLQAIRWDSIDKKAKQSDALIAEKEIALEQLMAELRSIEAGIEESREQLIRNGTSWGVDLNKWIKKGLLKIICRYPESMGPEDHLITIKKEMDEFKPNRMVIDSLSAMERVLTLRSFREFVISLSSYTKLKEIAGMFTSTTKTLLGGESITEAHISTLTDAIIILRYVEMHGEMRRGLTVIKLRGSWHEKEIREYNIDNEGMHVSEPFRGVESIMTGAARSVTQYEEDELKKLTK